MLLNILKLIVCINCFYLVCTVEVLKQMKVDFLIRRFLFHLVCTIRVWPLCMASDGAVAVFSIDQIVLRFVVQLVTVGVRSQFSTVVQLTFYARLSAFVPVYPISVQDSDAQSATCFVLHIHQARCDVCSLHASVE